MCVCVCVYIYIFLKCTKCFHNFIVYLSFILNTQHVNGQRHKKLSTEEGEGDKEIQTKGRMYFIHGPYIYIYIYIERERERERKREREREKEREKERERESTGLLLYRLVISNPNMQKHVDLSTSAASYIYVEVVTALFKSKGLDTLPRHFLDLPSNSLCSHL